MTTKQSAQSSIRRLSGAISDLQAQDAALAEKIDRLKTAKREILPIYQDDKSFFNWVNNYDVGARWQGSRREEFEEHKAEAKSAGDNYCGVITEIYSAIEEIIQQCEGERISIFWEIQGLQASMNGLQFNLNIGMYE